MRQQAYLEYLKIYFDRLERQLENPIENRLYIELTLQNIRTVTKALECAVEKANA